MQKPCTILGIDPGTVIMGFSVIATKGDVITVNEMDALKLPVKSDNYQRLQLIYEKTTSLIRVFRPHVLAIEAPFFGKNVQSMLKLGRAQGVAIAAAIGSGIAVTEYPPRKIKQAITGNGNADKEQVWKMLQTLTHLPDKPKYLDASDALAVAVCHFFQDRFPSLKKAAVKKGKSGWAKFAEDNEHRIAE